VTGGERKTVVGVQKRSPKQTQTVDEKNGKENEKERTGHGQLVRRESDPSRAGAERPSVRERKRR